MFFLLLSFCINGVINIEETKKEALALAFVMLFFLIYVSIDLFKVYSLKIIENGIEKTSLIFRSKQYIPFSSILNIDRQKSSLRNTRGINVRDDYHYNILKFDNGNSLIISPDNFENYNEIIEVIKNRIE